VNRGKKGNVGGEPSAKEMLEKKNRTADQRKRPEKKTTVDLPKERLSKGEKGVQRENTH